MKKLYIKQMVMLSGVLLAPGSALAQFTNPVNEDSLLGIICNVRDTLFPILMAFAVLAFLVAGYFYISANGDQGKLTQGKRALLAAVIGVIAAIFSFGLPTIIFELFGANVSDAC